MTVLSFAIMIMPVLFAAASSFDRKYEKSMSEGNRENALIYIRSAESLDTLMLIIK